MKEKKIFLRCIRTVSESQSPNQSAQTPGRMGNFLGRHDCCRKRKCPDGLFWICKWGWGTFLYLKEASGVGLLYVAFQKGSARPTFLLFVEWGQAVLNEVKLSTRKGVLWSAEHYPPEFGYSCGSCWSHHILMPGSVLTPLRGLVLLILTATLSGGYYYNPQHQRN